MELPWLTNLADIARRTGFPVTEISGWERRGREPQREVAGIVCHHTAGPRGNGDYPSLNVVKNGRAGLPGPLSHFGLGRSGRIYVIAAGRCNHNAPSTSVYHINSRSIGIEAENNGRQKWPSQQLKAYHALCAELCDAFDLSHTRVKGHKEVNTTKPDPHSLSMNAFRRNVAGLMKGGDLPLNSNDLANLRNIVQDELRRMWNADECPAPYNPEGNPNWKFVNVLRTGALANHRMDIMEDQIAATNLRLDKIIELLSQETVAEKEG